MRAILPGATLGVLGSGQLGRMFAIAARRMGYRVHTFSPDSDTPTGQVSDREYERPYDDLEAVREFARGVEVVTFEFENVPSATVAAHGGQEGVLEAFIAFERGVSVVAARGLGGEFAHYGVVENTHSRHILDLTVAPAAVEERTAREAVAIARAVLEELNVVGVTCVEFFLTRGGKRSEEHTS